MLAAMLLFLFSTGALAETRQTEVEVLYYEIIHYNEDGSIKDQIIVPANARTDMSTYSTYISVVVCTLSVDPSFLNAKATSTGTVRLKRSCETSFTVMLQQSEYDADDWSEVNSWNTTVSQANDPVTLSKVWYVPEGYDYRAVASATAMNGNMPLETVKAYSSIKTF